MLRVDNTLMVQDDYAPVPPATGLFLYDMEIANRSDHHHFDTRPRYYKQPAQVFILKLSINLKHQNFSS